MSIKSEENKELLLQILNETHLKKNYPEDFYDIFNTEINTIHLNRLKYNSNLTEMNKIILSRSNPDGAR